MRRGKCRVTSVECSKAEKRHEEENRCPYSLLFALSVSAEAQQGKKIPRIGLLASAVPSTYLDRIAAFEEGPRDLGLRPYRRRETIRRRKT